MRPGRDRPPAAATARAAARSATRSTMARVANMPVLTLRTREIAQHGLDLQADEVRLEHDDAAHGRRALGGDGGQRGGPVHPVGGKGLEVGLGAGPATRVRSGNAQCNRWSIGSIRG